MERQRRGWGVVNKTLRKTSGSPLGTQCEQHIQNRQSRPVTEAELIGEGMAGRVEGHAQNRLQEAEIVSTTNQGMSGV